MKGKLDFKFNYKDIYKLIEITKQAHYENVKKLKKLEEDYLQVKNYIESYLEEGHLGCGLRKMYETSPDSLAVGRDKFMEISRELGYKFEAKRSVRRTTNPDENGAPRCLLNNLVLTGKNQLWTADLTYLQSKDKTYYIFFIMDVYTREIIGYSVDTKMTKKVAVKALRMALKKEGRCNLSSLIHHSDRGTQYTSTAYKKLLRQNRIKQSTSKFLLENSHVERLNGIIKNEYLLYFTYEKLVELKKAIDNAVYHYNHKRIHNSLNKLSPVAFKNKVQTLKKSKRIKMKIFNHNEAEQTNRYIMLHSSGRKK